MRRVLSIGVAVAMSACFGGREPGPQIARSDCELCHAGDDAAHTMPQPQRCTACHSNQAWQPLDYSGHDVLFPISYGHHRFDCEQCHLPPDGVFDFSCIDCHEHTRDRTDRHHGGVGGYQYEPHSCLRCHPEGGE